MKYHGFDLDKVKVNNRYILNAHHKMIAYLLELEPDRLLAGFREAAGIDTHGAKRYEGWESTLIGGHTMGHYLTGIAQAYGNANTSSEEKEQLLQRMSYVIAELYECQANSRGKAGFLWGAVLLDPNDVEHQFDAVERGNCDIFQHAWVPWYTIHKILSGLLAVYKHVGLEQARLVAERLGDWVSNRALSWNEEKRNVVLSIEYGGMNDVMYELFEVTQNDTYRLAAYQFDEDSLFDRIRTAQKDTLNNHHANTMIPKIVGSLHRYEVTGEEAYLQTAQIFWDTVTKHHTYATGDNSENEHFGPDDVLAHELSNCNCETCNAYNMLKLTSKLFCITGEVQYADYYERTMINTILASQHPETGMTTYFQSMANGYFKVFGRKFDTFWCCTGSGMESMTKLNSNIYFEREGELVVNQFVSSEVMGKCFGVTQESHLLDKGITKLQIHTTEPQQSYTLKIRIPDWCKDDISVQLGDHEYTHASKENGYVSINRTWENGDYVIIRMDLKCIANKLPDDAMYSFQYGPIVLCADMGKDAMETGQTGVNVTIPKIGENQCNTLLFETGIDVTDVIECPFEYFVRDGESLAWSLRGCLNDYTFVPYYSMYESRYGMHWYVKENI